MTLIERIVARYLKAARDPSKVWLPDLLGGKAHLVDELLAAIKRAQTESLVNTDPKAWAGGLLYLLVKEQSGKQVADKLWGLLDANAGLGLGSEVHQVAARAAAHLDSGPEGIVQAAGIGVSLLQRTKQPNKAERANSIMVAEPTIAKALAEMSPVGERSKPQSATAEFTTMVKEQGEYAREIATKIKKNPKVAAALVWLTLEDVNAHSESATAESILSVLQPSPDETSQAQGLAGKVGQHLDWGVVEAGAFGVALMIAVGQASLARSLAKAMVTAFGKFLGPGNLFE